MPSLSTTLPALAAGLTITLWAGAFVAIDQAIAHVDPLAAVRFAIAGTVACLWLVCARPTRPSRADLVRLTLCGAIGIALYNVLLAAGQRGVDPGSASFIVATQPFFAALAARFLLGERWPAAVVYLSLGAGIVAYVCWMRALDGLGATRAANLLFLMAPLAMLISAAIDQSVPPFTTIAGGALALCGVAIGARGNHTNRGRQCS